MGSLFGGGSSGGGDVSFTTPPNPTGVPLQEPLMGIGTRNVNQAAPFSYAGSGANLLPQVPFGQVLLGGPNPTQFGNVTDPQYAQSFYGPQSGQQNVPQPHPTPQQNQTQKQQQGQQQQSQPQKQQQQTPPQGQFSQQGAIAGGYYPPPIQNQQYPGGQFPQFLSQLLMPGVLGQLMRNYSQSLAQPSGGVMPPAQKQQKPPQMYGQPPTDPNAGRGVV